MNDIICPFCGDTGFDLVGLKMHLILYCDVYDTISLIDEENNESSGEE